MGRIVVVGASWGGLHALQALLGALPADFGAPICVAQHRTEDDDEAALAALLDAATPLHVADADDKQPLRAGEVLVAPPGYHLLVERGAAALSIDEPVRFSRPSIDVLFESAADAYRERAIGVILTGSNADGSVGLARIHARGGMAFVQDPADAERAEMPRAALAATRATVLPLRELGPRLAAVVHELEPAGGER